ncbi:MFS transporter [Nonomuraea insulae]|uniref:MFS transporter n=1 Tax=Nonomuraea insulae TaxID=1616787 RepID=A0ABW1CQQ3_9ACTN
MAVDRIQRRRAIAAGSIGTVIEWYDFALYGLASALVFAPLFFPGAGTLGGLLGALGTFAVGLGVRPLGGLIFAHYGDRLGRKPVLLVTLLIMGVCTTLIGALPTAESIGVWAPIALVLLRLLQGAGAGAEYAGAITMVSEFTERRRRGLVASYPGAAIYVGTALATVLFALVSLLPADAFLAWGWRVPFLLSIVVLAIATYVRLRVPESPEFADLERSDSLQPAPVKEALRTETRAIICGFGLFTFIIPWAYLMQVFVLSHVSNDLHVSKSVALTGLIIAEVLTVVAIPLFGILSDRIGRKKVLTGGAIFAILYVFPMFWLLGTGNPVVVTVAMVLGLAGVQGATSGPAAALMAELFSTRVRWSGLAISRELPAAVVGGTMPLVATALLAWSGGGTWSIAAYVATLSVIGLICVRLLPETLWAAPRAPVGNLSETY